MAEKKELKVGDRIYALDRNCDKIKSIMTIDRVTKTMAITNKGIRFRKEYFGNHIRTVDRGYSFINYELETDELKQLLIRQNKLAFIARFDFTSLSTEQLTEVENLINSFRKINDGEDF